LRNWGGILKTEQITDTIKIRHDTECEFESHDIIKCLTILGSMW